MIMLVKYNGKYYFCYELSNNLLISTKKIEKSDGTFTKDGDYWYKKVRLDNEKKLPMFLKQIYMLNIMLDFKMYQKFGTQE